MSAPCRASSKQLVESSRMTSTSLLLFFDTWWCDAATASRPVHYPSSTLDDSSSSFVGWENCFSFLIWRFNRKLCCFFLIFFWKRKWRDENFDFIFQSLIFFGENFSVGSFDNFGECDEPRHLSEEHWRRAGILVTRRDAIRKVLRTTNHQKNHVINMMMLLFR